MTDNKSSPTNRPLGLPYTTNLILVILLLSCISSSVKALPTSQNDARQLFKQALKKQQSGDTVGALAGYIKAQKTAPKWALPKIYWALLAETLNPNDEAIDKSLNEAILLAPNNPRAHYLLGKRYSKKRITKQAIKHLSRAHKLRPEMPGLRFQLALVLARDRQYQAAIPIYEQIVMRDPHHIAALIALAELYERVENNDHAAQTLRRIAQLQPHIPRHLDKLADFFERQGEHKKATRVRKKANANEPQTQRVMRRLR